MTRRAPMPDVFAEPTRGAAWLTTPPEPPPKRPSPKTRLRTEIADTIELFPLDTK